MQVGIDTMQGHTRAHRADSRRSWKHVLEKALTLQGDTSCVRSGTHTMQSDTICVQHDTIVYTRILDREYSMNYSFFVFFRQLFLIACSPKWNRDLSEFDAFRPIAKLARVRGGVRGDTEPAVQRRLIGWGILPGGAQEGSCG